MGSHDANEPLTTLEVFHSKRSLTILAFENGALTNSISKLGTFYNWQTLKALEDYLSPGELVLDIGANIGNNSLYFSGICSAQVIAYEANPKTAAILQKNIESNYLDDKVHIRRVRVGSTSKSLETSHDLLENQDANMLALGPETTLDTTLDLEQIADRVQLIYIQVEARALAILEGAIGLIMRDRPFIACDAVNPSSVEALTAFAVEIGYTFAGAYGPAPTHLLVPCRHPSERVQYERRAAVLATQTNILARDLNYRLSLVDQRLADVEHAITCVDDGSDGGSPNLSLAQRIAAMNRRLELVETAIENRVDSEFDRICENQLDE